MGEDDAVEGDDASDERHLFGKPRETTVGYLASEMGVLRVELAPDRLGGFGIVERCQATAIAAAGDTVVVGSHDDVLRQTGEGDGFIRVGFGEAVAVGLDDDRLLAASPEGAVAAAPTVETAGTDTTWESLTEVTDPRAFDGALLATGDGVVRLGSTVENLGLENVNDVVQSETDDGDGLLAGGEGGLFEYGGGGWKRILSRSIAWLSQGEKSVFAVSESGAVLKRSDTGWNELRPEEHSAVAVAAAESTYVLTEGGELLIATDAAAATDGVGGWQSQPLGVGSVHGFVLGGR